MERALLRIALAGAFLPLSFGTALAEEDSFPLPCAHARSDLGIVERCARREGEKGRISAATIARMRFRHGLAEVMIPGIGWLWTRRDGLALPVLTVDNGPDPFVQGLTRARRAGKIAFYDRRLRLVLATPFDWAFPFNDQGEALVCEGCRSDGHPEHASMVGGRWAIIDRKGLVLIPLAEDGEPSNRYFNRRR